MAYLWVFVYVCVCVLGKRYSDVKCLYIHRDRFETHNHITVKLGVHVFEWQYKFRLAEWPIHTKTSTNVRGVAVRIKQYACSFMQAKYIKQWTIMGAFISLNMKQEGTLEFVQIRHLKLFVGDSESQIKARSEVYSWTRTFSSPKIMPEVIVLMNFMGPKHYLACSQDPSGHWKSGGHSCKWDFQMQAMHWRFSLQTKYQMFYLITMDSQKKQVANSWVQRLYPTITGAIFFAVEFRLFSRLTIPY